MLFVSCFAAAQEKINITLIVDENGVITFENLTQEKPSEPPSDPITPPVGGPVLFDEDIQQNMPVSTPTSPHIPLGLNAQFDLTYQGAFRVTTKRGESSSEYAVGILGYNPTKNSLFMAGHDHDDAIAEFAIPLEFSLSTSVSEIVNADVLQSYKKILSDTKNNKITGMLAYNDSLIVNSEIWYDASGKNADNQQVLNINDITESPKGMLQLQGKAQAAGYMSKIPDNLTSVLGGNYLTGWASNWSITGRYSQGPSLHVFNPQDSLDNALTVPSTSIQNYPMIHGKMLVDGANNTANDNVSPIWGPMSRAFYGFIVPDTSIFMVVGRHAGLHSWIGYKGRNITGKYKDGSFVYNPSDVYNYFWLFDINEMLETPNTYDVKPFSYGKWVFPYDGGVIGAAFDNNNMLYISVYGAGAYKEYDRPPMILAYKITAKRG